MPAAAYRLVDLFPRPVPLALQGRTYAALPLRLSDLADLEALALEALPGLLDGLPPEHEADPADPGYRQALRVAYEHAQYGLPGWGSPEVHAIALGTLQGRVVMLSAVLRGEDTDTEAVVELAAALAPEEWAAVDHVAFGLDDTAGLARRIDAAALVKPDDGDGRGTGWGEMVAELCLALGKTPSEVAGLTIPEFRALLHRGRRPPLFSEADSETIRGLRWKLLAENGTGADAAPTRD